MNEIVPAGLDKRDIGYEEWREYKFSNGSIYRIDCPVALYTRLYGGTTHRVVDGTGVVHCVAYPGPSGATVLRWKVKDGSPAVSF